MDAVHKHEFKLRDLATRAVTLFPARAQVSREIKDLALRPGINEITIVGLTPTIDEDSIKVEGTGSAVISDLSVELLPNRELFEDIYPDLDDDDDEAEVNDTDEDAEFKASPELQVELDAIDKQLIDLDDERKLAQELVNSVNTRQRILDHHGQEIKLTEPDHIRQNMDVFEKEREKISHSRIAAEKQLREVDERSRKVREAWSVVYNRIQRERRKAELAKQKSEKAAAKIKELENRRRAEVRAEKLRVRRDRERFWPKMVYTVRITLDATSMASPTSSRRSSVASAADLVKPTPEPEDGSSFSGSSLVCGLVLNYLTDAAFWAPSYDLQLSTTSDKATLLFDAKITNITSETWSNCRVTLSTSQTTFSGLTDTIPSLTPWHIKLGPKGFHGKGSMSSPSSFAGGAILNSNEEKFQLQSFKDQHVKKTTQKPRGQMFGYSRNALVQAPGAANVLDDFDFDSFLGGPAPVAAAIPPPPQASLFGAANNMVPNPHMNAMRPDVQQMQQMQQIAQQQMQIAQQQRQQMQARSMAAAPAPLGDTTEANRLQDYQMGLMTLEQQNKKRLMMARQEQDAPRAGGFPSHRSGGGGGDDGNFPDPDEGDGATIIEAEPELEFQDSAMEETGLTTTYDLPGTKTLAPRATPFKQRVARVTLSSVVFSHTIVAKYKPLAYLKARLRNASPVTVLKGRAGLTLDGTFLGQTTLPRCSVGDAFTLSLGIDPAVKVTYPAPEVRRATTGVFSKEDSSVFTRVATVTNTRSAAGGRPVNVMVYDQVPVSEDERLRVDVLYPKGLGVGGAGVATGTGNKTGDKDWGRAVATLKKTGEVCWDATVQPGKSVRLTLEYVVAMPSGETAMQC